MPMGMNRMSFLDRKPGREDGWREPEADDCSVEGELVGRCTSYRDGPEDDSIAVMAAFWRALHDGCYLLKTLDSGPTTSIHQQRIPG